MDIEFTFGTIGESRAVVSVASYAQDSVSTVTAVSGSVTFMATERRTKIR